MSKFDFGMRLYYARKKKGLTQEELSEKCGITQTQYSMYEVGRRYPSVENLLKLKTTLDVSLDWLFAEGTL